MLACGSLLLNLAIFNQWSIGGLGWFLSPHERDCYLGVPQVESQTTGPRTTHLTLVDILLEVQKYFGFYLAPVDNDGWRISAILDQKENLNKNLRKRSRKLKYGAGLAVMAWLSRPP